MWTPSEPNLGEAFGTLRELRGLEDLHIAEPQPSHLSGIYMDICHTEERLGLIESMKKPKPKSMLAKSVSMDGYNLFKPRREVFDPIYYRW